MGNWTYVLLRQWTYPYHVDALTKTARSGFAQLQAPSPTITFYLQRGRSRLTAKHTESQLSVPSDGVTGDGIPIRRGCLANDV